MKLSDEQYKRMREEMFDRMWQYNKIIYPSDIERSKSPREFGRTVKNHKRSNNRKR